MSNSKTKTLLQKHIFSVAKIFGVDIMEIVQNSETWIKKPKALRVLQKLENDFPVDYLIGYVKIHDLCLKVDANTLIPRPETEHWILDWSQKIIKTLQNLDNDLGCGLRKMNYGFDCDLGMSLGMNLEGILKNGLSESLVEDNLANDLNVESKRDSNQDLGEDAKSLDKAQKQKKPFKKAKVIILDIGTGTGLIILHLQKTLEKYFNSSPLFENIQTQLMATDIDPKTLKTAKYNYRQNQPDYQTLLGQWNPETKPKTSPESESNTIPKMNSKTNSPDIAFDRFGNVKKNTKISFCVSDNLKNPALIKKLKASDYVILVSNPPYVPVSDIDFSVQNKVAWEPQGAIYAGEDGLTVFRELLEDICELDLWSKILEITLELDPRNIYQARDMLTKNVPFQITNYHNKVEPGPVRDQKTELQKDEFEIDIQKDCECRDRLLLLKRIRK